MKLNYRRTILTGFAFMAISAFWQMYDTIIPLILKNSFQMGELLTGVVMSADNVLALFLLPIFGSLSDKTNTPIGKRKPYILLGTLATCIAMIFIPYVDNLQNMSGGTDNMGPLIAFMCVLGLILVFMGTFRSPAVALMPDVTPRPLRSKGNAIINLTGTAGAIVTLLLSRFLVPKGDNPDYSIFFYVLILFMIVCVAILGVTVSEDKWAREARQTEEMHGVKDEEPEVKKPHGKLSSGEMRSLILILLSVAFWYMAYNGVTSAFSRYVGEVWPADTTGYEAAVLAENADGAATVEPEEVNYEDCLMVATVAAIISYVPIGFLASAIGRKKCILIGIVGLVLGFLYVGFFGSYHFAVNFGFVLIGVSWATINVNSFPMVVEIASDGDVGKYTGYYYVFSMAAQVITPILSGALLQWVSYRTLFPYAVVFSVLAFITMIGVKHGDSRPKPAKSFLENFDVDD